MASKNLQVIAFETLIDCCANNQESKRELLTQAHHLIEQEEDVLYELMEFVALKEIHFFVNVGIADGWGPNSWIESETRHVLDAQFPNLEIEIPEAKNYEDTKWLSLPVLKDYDNALRKHQLQFSHIENEHTDYLCVIHKINDRDKLLHAFEAIDYKFLEI